MSEKHSFARSAAVLASTATLAAVMAEACMTPHQGARQEAGTMPATWYAGDSACAGAPRMRVHAYNPDFYILRQAACTNFEKPFLYLVFGSERALLFDSGAGGVDIVAPVDSIIRAWLARTGRPSVALVVAHSHAHGDHVAGDAQFARRPNTVVVGRDTASVRAFFGVTRWPADSGRIDLGGRVLDVLPIPGHQPASIALYDARTRVLLTGDTFYPGRLYVRDTAAFATSIARLAAFTRAHRVSALLGAHVEQQRTPFTDYPVGTLNQPDEHGLALTPASLFALDSVVRGMRGRVVRTGLADVTVWPVP